MSEIEKNILKRFAEILMLFGVKGTGKTTFAARLAEIMGKPVAVVDTYEHPHWISLGYKVFASSEIPYWDGKENILVCDGFPLENVCELMYYHRNFCLIIEDAKKVLTQNPSRQEMGIFIDNKNKGIDIILMFHNLKDAPPYHIGMSNRFVMFKTKDNLGKYLDKYGADWEEMVERQARIRKLIAEETKPAWYNETIKIQ
jgi:hypothetical protein